MAYNNGFPIGYQPIPQYYQQNYQPQQNTAQNQSNGIIWVSGEAGAKAYLVAPNTTVQLWDSDENVIYVKSADASGMPSMKILDYTIRENADKKVGLLNNTDFVTKDEVSKEIKRLEKMIAEASKTIGVSEQAQ